MLRQGSEDSLLKVNKPSGKPPKYTVEELKKVFDANPQLFNRELGELLSMGLTTVHYHRVKMGYTNKKATTTYRESNPVLKKTSLKK